DASQGSKLTKGATLFPSTIGLAASFDRELAYAYGRAVAEECRADGFRILLGPGVNIYRVPNGGRNFEYLGEDPCLASQLVVPYIKGVQEAGVIATVKHFAANNCEYFRRSANSVVDERTLREIYFPAFRAAIEEAGCGALMTAYNPVNGDWAAENRWLVTDILRNEWGFDGLVMTDWWSIYDPEKVLTAGVDLEMPYAEILTKENVLAVLESGKITEADLDERVRCILRPCVEFGLLDQPHADPSLHSTWDAHAEVARQIGRESLVLLKNRNSLLPLDRSRVRRIALFGKNAVETSASGGGAAGFEPGDAFVTYEAAIRAAAGEQVEVKVYPEHISAEAAEEADIAVVFLTMVEHEQMDRNFEFDEDSLYTLNRVASVNPNTIAVVSLGGGVEMASWIDDVAALVYAWYPGTYGATALGEMLFGDLNPSGRLPISIEKRPEDTHYFGNYLPEDVILPRTFHGWDSKHERFDVEYREGILTGYRWYDTRGIEPLFPFGFGLSYTSFSYGDLMVTTGSEKGGPVARVRLRVRNDGDRAGAEVVQLYVSDPECDVRRPAKELKGFARIALEPGEEREVEFLLGLQDLSYWSDAAGQWMADPGTFEILIGASSRDIRLQAPFRYESRELY
ncbi:MAG: glycoside hydrolase family 3 C-terminal domain-containing protein, partial [Pontiellaceae bacterium]|nr:glycoside hydrolase family 3 C-terminal domain-containing protein [Pontiellaceae bacterium]